MPDAPDASGQQWSPCTYNENVRFVSELGQGVLEWLDPKPGQSILDLGCGDGVLTKKIADTGADVFGVDSSPQFIDALKVLGLNGALMDGHALEFDARFDAVFSNAALHWMLDPQKVIDGVARALKANGRFVGEFGGFGNVAAIVTALRGVASKYGGDQALASPWFFPTPAEYSGMLEQGGFRVDRCELFYRQTPLPTGIQGWLQVFRGSFFEQFGDSASAVLDDVVETLRFSLCDSEGLWHADYVRLRFEATKSA